MLQFTNGIPFSDYSCPFIRDKSQLWCAMQADENSDKMDDLTKDNPDCLTLPQSSVKVNVDSLRFVVNIYPYSVLCLCIMLLEQIHSLVLS